MQDGHAIGNAPLRFTALRGPTDMEDPYQHIRIFLCLSGELRVISAPGAADARRDDGRWTLVPEDLHLVNAGDRVRIAASDACYIRFELDSSELQRCFPERVLRFECSSVAETSDDIDRLRSLLSKAVAASYEGGDLAGVKVRSAFYDVAALLMERFSIQLGRGTSDRMAAIRSFVSQHYAENISIERMGRVFFVTPQYFSKYVKEQTGETFHRYLERIRVAHAADALARTDDTILKVALDAGFPNAESLRRACVREYGVAPGEFRRQRKREAVASFDANTVSIDEAVALMDVADDEGAPGLEEMEVDARNGMPYEPYWRDAVSLGELILLEGYEAREQFARVQRMLNFRYVRFGVSHAFVEGEEAVRKALYFEDRQMDYLFHLGAKPWVMLEYVPDIPIERYCGYLRQLISHYANRIDMSNVLSWRFELSLGVDGASGLEGYADCYLALSRILDEAGHEEGLIGPSLSLADLDGLGRWFDVARSRGIETSVQTFRVNPKLATDRSASLMRGAASDSSYVKDRLYALGRRLSDYRSGIDSLRITEWDSSFPGCDPLNDSCYRGAATIKNLIDCFGVVDSLAPMSLLDITDGLSERRGPLYGGSGLVTRHGIPKPAFFAYELMNRAGSVFLSKSSHAAVFSNGASNYQIVCHNAKRLSALHYAGGELTDLRELTGQFEDVQPLLIRVRVDGVENGSYIIKKRSVSSSEGSIQDKFLNMGCASVADMHPNDVEYLERVTTPSISVGVAVAFHGSLELEIELAANEFANVHVIHQFE